MKTLPQGQNHRSAFSIIELLIVVAIIAAITGLAAPAFLSSQRGFALTRAGNELTDLANYARQLLARPRHHRQSHRDGFLV